MTSIYETIKKVCEKRREEKIYPPSVSFVELTKLSDLEEKELRRQLNGLYTIGMINVYKTINGIGIEIFDREKHEKRTTQKGGDPDH